eukprot:Selendium_serpulae@DN4765_c0_g1_i1.p1
MTENLNHAHSALIDEIIQFNPESGNILKLCRKLAVSARLSVDFECVPPIPCDFDSRWGGVGSPACESLSRAILESCDAESVLHNVITRSEGGDADPLFCFLFSVWWDSTKVVSQASDSAPVSFSFSRGLIIGLMPTALWTYLSRTLLKSSPRLHDCHSKRARNDELNEDGSLVDNVLGIEAVLVSCSLYFSCLPRNISIINVKELSSIAHDKRKLNRSLISSHPNATNNAGDPSGFQFEADYPGSDDDSDVNSQHSIVGPLGPTGMPPQIAYPPTRGRWGVFRRSSEANAKTAQKEEKITAQKMISSLREDVAVSRTFANDRFESGVMGDDSGGAEGGDGPGTNLMKTARARVHPDRCTYGPLIVTERTLNVILVKLMAVYQSHDSRVSLRSSLVFLRFVCSALGFDFSPVAPSDITSPLALPSSKALPPAQPVFAASSRTPMLYESRDGPHVRIPTDDELLVNALRAVSSCMAHNGQAYGGKASSRPAKMGVSTYSSSSTSEPRASTVYDVGVAAMKVLLLRAELEVLPQAVYYALSLLNILGVS